MNGELRDYQRLFDAISAMVFVITYRGDILSVNSAVVSNLGYSRSELLRMNVLALHPAGSEEEVSCVLSRLADSSETICTLPLVTKNGNFIEVETRIYKGEWEGNPVLFGISSDVTQQRTSERKFRAIFDFSPIPIAVSRLADGYMIDVNSAWCRLMGFQREAVVGKKTTDLGVWADTSERDALLEALLHAPRIDGYPVHLLNASGDSVYGLMSGTVTTISGEELWVTSMVDYTERKLLEDQLDEIRELTITSALEQLEKQFSRNKYIRG